MKKLSLLLLLSVFVFIGCSDDDKATFTASFEGKLTEANSAYTSNSIEKKGYYFYDTFEDNNKLMKFDHYYIKLGDVRYMAGFAYTNNSDIKTANSYASITGKAKTATTYLSAFTNSDTPAAFIINNNSYVIKGAWVTNSKYAYTAMTEDYNVATKFTKDSWFKLTATGYDDKGGKTGTAEIYLANYKSDDDKPVSDWIWFDMKPLNYAAKIVFSLSSTDSGHYGMNTPAYFCMDGITLEEK